MIYISEMQSFQKNSECMKQNGLKFGHITCSLWKYFKYQIQSTIYFYQMYFGVTYKKGLKKYIIRMWNLFTKDYLDLIKNAFRFGFSISVVMAIHFLNGIKYTFGSIKPLCFQFDFIQSAILLLLNFANENNYQRS